MRRAGLERQHWVEAIDDFVRQHGRATPRWAIFLTYELTLDTLARAVLPVLARRGRQFRSVVLADQGALEAALSLGTSTLPGAVNLHPVRCTRGGVFHPKLVFLRAGRHVRACFGSANVTDGGLGTNLELWTQTESAEILAGLQNFLADMLHSRDIALDEGARRSIRRALCGLPQAPTPSVWSSFDGSFARRLHEGPERRAPRATILSPMYAGAAGVRAARKAIPAANVQLYTTTSVPVPATTLFVYDPPHPADQKADDLEAFPRTLHAKAYVFHPAGGGATHAWMGSANFTAQALTKSVAQGGNVELMVHAVVPADEADALDADLKVLFKRRKVSDAPDAPDTSTPRRPIATVLACELVGSPEEPRLVVHALIRQGKVVLEHGKRCLQVRITAGRGVVDGPALRRFLPDLDLAAAQVLVVRQRLGRRTIPIVVNVPHVPAESEGNGAHAALDALLDDLLGRVRIPVRSTPPDDVEADGAGDESDVDPDADGGALERRLDEVRHQGELDQLAVKAAFLRKLAIQSTAAGTERDGVMGEILRALLAACPAHLKPAVHSLFGNHNSGEGV